MSSQTRDSRGDANRLDVRTLAIASLASAVAAIVVSRFWASGTPIAAAATPVFVTIFKEMLDRPTTRIAERLTTDSRALRATRVREPVAVQAGRERSVRGEPPRRTPPPDRSRRPAGATNGKHHHDREEIRVYRPQPRRGLPARVNPKVALLTGLLAFVIAGLVITGGQVLAGNPFGNGGNGAIILGQHKKNKSSSNEDEQKQQQQTTPDQQQTAPQDQQQQQSTTPQQQNGKTDTTPSEPQQTPQQQQAPRSQPAPSPSAPPASP